MPQYTRDIIVALLTHRKTAARAREEFWERYESKTGAAPPLWCYTPDTPFEVAERMLANYLAAAPDMYAVCYSRILRCVDYLNRHAGTNAKVSRKGDYIKVTNGARTCKLTLDDCRDATGETPPSMAQNIYEKIAAEKDEVLIKI